MVSVNSNNKDNNSAKDTKATPQVRPKLTRGQVLSDKLSSFAGSWTFIIIFLSFLFVWMLINVLVIFLKWDPYPFILLNLVLSCVAALQAPVILMSQNRVAERDRIKAERDYFVNRKSEREVENMQQDLDEIKKLIHKLYNNNIKK